MNRVRRDVGRPRRVAPGTLYAFAHQFYWDFRRLAEGRVRWRFDRAKYQELTAKLDEMQLIDDDDRTRHEQIVNREIETGELDPFRREDRLRDIAEAEIFARRESYRQQAAGEARKEIRVPGERDALKVLLDPYTTPEQIRELCKEAVMIRTCEGREIEVSAWPISSGSVLPDNLSKYAEQYVAAMRHPRFPHCDVSARPSNRLKQFWFLSRALAGALFGITTRTAINLVGSLRPEEIFEESRDGKPARKQRKRKNKR